MQWLWVGLIAGAAVLFAPAVGFCAAPEGAIGCHGFYVELEDSSTVMSKSQARYPVLMRSGPGNGYKRLRPSEDLDITLSFDIVARKGNWLELDADMPVWVTIDEVYIPKDVQQDEQAQVDLKNGCLSGIKVK
ncbi:hypothetical protein [Asticcacaulis solisilvae]|uniref:hypothetical protein n=1 Tax=Asticcacaulis solisilvae TaxID=1217274 RepID=UPI003FD7A454